MSKLNTLTDEEIVPTIAQSTEPSTSIPTEIDQKELSCQLKQYLLDKCCEYIGNEWKNVDLPLVTINRISGGTSNIIYTVTNNSCSQDFHLRTVLVRIYGRFLMASFRNQLKDAVVFTVLSERSLGPKLHGIFEHGRVEEFINARGLSPMDVRSPSILPFMAARMAQIHNLKVPIFKSRRFLFDTMRGWLEGVDKLGTCIKFFNCESNLEDELVWLQDILWSQDSTICFCHNDLQAGNILLRSEGSPQSPDDLVVIDYEYCSYNYREYDLANFFCEWAFEYSNEYKDGFCYNPQSCPTTEEKVEFIETYIGHWNLYSSEKMSLGDVESLVGNIRLFELASHIFWSLWSMRQSQSSTIGFGYKEYAGQRLKLYFDLKKIILSEK